MQGSGAVGFECSNYEKQLQKFRHFVKEQFQVIQFEELKPIHVKEYISSLQDRGCKPAYINDLLKAVKCLCSYAQREGYSEEVLTKRVKNVLFESDCDGQGQAVISTDTAHRKISKKLSNFI